MMVVGVYVLVAAVSALVALRNPLQRSKRQVDPERSNQWDSDLRSETIRLDGGVDVELIEEYVTGARVLVTGASGSIGRALCIAVMKRQPAELIAVDLWQGGHVNVYEDGAGTATRSIVADVRSADQLNAIFAANRPEVVIHCASLERAAMVEMHPVEGWRTNVLGSNIVLRAAATYGVGHFVNLSSMEAANPSGALDYMHRISEQLTAWYANRIRGQWVSVRFGHTRGSVESVAQLILEAGALGGRGEALVLDVGESGRGIAEDEPQLVNVHPRITHVPVPPLRPTVLGLFDDSTPKRAVSSLKAISSPSPERTEAPLQYLGK